MIWTDGFEEYLLGTNNETLRPTTVNIEDEYASLHETGALVDESLLSWIILFGSMRIWGGAFAFDGAVVGCC